MGRTSTTSKSSFAAIASWRLTFAGEQVGPIFRFFFLIGFGAKALSQGRKGFAFFFACLLAPFPLSCPLSRALSFPSLSLSLCTLPGRPTGDGYAEFATAAEASRALAERQHGSLGSRYVELFPERGADPGADPASAGRPLPGGLGNPVLRLRGLPFTAAAEDVVDFLLGRRTGREEEDEEEEEERRSSDEGSSRRTGAAAAAPGSPPTNPEAMPRLGPQGVVFTSSPDGRPSGEAYVEFESARAAAAALNARDGAALGPRFVRFLVFLFVFIFLKGFPLPF